MGNFLELRNKTDKKEENTSKSESIDFAENKLSKQDSMLEHSVVKDDKHHSIEDNSVNDQNEKTNSEKLNNSSDSQKDKKIIRPSVIELKGKSEAFKKIIDIAIAYEKSEQGRKSLTEKNSLLTNEVKELQQEKKQLTDKLSETELLCNKRLEEISNLNAEIDKRNIAIDVVKADKTKSDQEFKMALAASLKSMYSDFIELKTLDMSDDVGYAFSETLDKVFKVLEKYDITMSN